MTDTEINVRDNGPLLIRGENVVVKDGEGNGFDLGGKETVALCRCALSANKPFCDGAHAGKFESQTRCS